MKLSRNQTEFLTMIYYYISIKNSNIKFDRDIQNLLFKIDFYNIKYSELQIINTYIDNLIFSSRGIEYIDSDMTDDKYLLNYYKNMGRVNKIKKML